MNRLFVGGVLSAGLKIAAAGLTFLMFMFLARAMGPAEYGRFASMFALGSIGAITALLGQHTLGIKTLSALGDAPAHAPVRRHILRRGVLIVLAGAALCIAALLGAGWLGTAMGLGLDGGVLLGAAAFVLPFALAELVSHQFRAFGAIGLALAPRDVLWRGGVMALGAGAAFWPAFFETALTTMLTISAALLAIVVVQAGLLRVKSRHLLSGEGAHDGASPLALRPAFWMWVATLGTMGANLNIVAASWFLAPEQVGVYFAAQKTSQLLQLPILAVNIVSAPIFARLHSLSDTAQLRAVARKLALLAAVPLFAGGIVILLFAEELLGLFDPTFAQAAATLLVLASSYLVIGFGGPTRQLMLMADGERHVVRLTFLSEAVGLALVPLLVPAYGIMGAAIAALAARVIFTLLTVLWCRRHLGVDTSALSLLQRG